MTFIMMTSSCICATIVGNVLVILSVFTYRPLNSVQNYFIVSLAVADLTVALLVMPLNVANYVIGEFLSRDLLWHALIGCLDVVNWTFYRLVNALTL